MKTLEELMNEVTTSESEAFKEEFLAAVKEEEGIEPFLRKYDCPATLEEFKEYLREKAAQNAEVSDQELEGINGGSWGTMVAASLLTGIFGCLFHAVGSVAQHMEDQHWRDTLCE